MSAKSISILNMKGGVGKTTTTINLAIELGETHNKKVLVVDLDPQFNSTQSLFMYTYKNLDTYFSLRDSGKTISSILSSGQNGVTRSREGRLATANEDSNIIHSLTDNLKILPGDLALTVEANSASSIKLKNFFRQYQVKNDFDYIIFDCPPTWGIYTTLALDMSDFYLIPTKLDEFSTIGIDILTQKIEEFVYALDEHKSLLCLGLIYTLTNRSRSQKGISRDQNVIKNIVERHFSEELEESLRSKVIPFSPILPFYPSIAHKSAVYSEHTNIPLLQLRMNDITSEIIRRCENPNMLQLEIIHS
ncbi:ParA family protein [Exiguobacterium sp. RIT594]|uniref:ParA family protein n=1 Tax=Exiguobacterium sp. RIT594 TaxID=2282449 RepID=UPI000DF83963|nr:AAA family ATPase [Exiguobacterium sp. RIT594]RDB32003.1 chromosome partitioning protein ParA [Exiguobacterium sp. RIT594]